MKNSYAEFKDKLKDDYWQIFDKIETYGQMQKTSFDMYGELYEDMMMNLIDMFLTAQENGTPVGKIIGKNVESFCKEYFESYKLKNNMLLRVFKRLTDLVWIIFVFELGEMILAFIDKGKEFSFLKVKTDMSIYLLSLLIGAIVLCIAVAIMKPLIFKSKWLTKEKAENIFIAIILIGGIGTAIFIKVTGLKVEVPLAAVLIIAAVYLAVYYVSKDLNSSKK